MNYETWPEHAEGYEAYLRGRPSHENPYYDFNKRMAWFQGHEDAWLNDK